MYWPCGVPRIYAYAGPKTLGTEPDVQAERDGASQSSDEIDEERTETGKDQPRPTEDEHDNSIFDLRVARLDHIFVTISASCLTIWSSRVSIFVLVEHSS